MAVQSSPEPRARLAPPPHIARRAAEERRGRRARSSPAQRAEGAGPNSAARPRRRRVHRRGSAPEGGAGGLPSRRAFFRPPLPRKINKYGRLSGPHPRRPGAGSARPPGAPLGAALGGGRRRRGARGYVMVPPRRRRRPGSGAAVGVCAGGRGLGVASALAPRAPCHCLGPCRLSPARLPSALSLPQFALSPTSRLPTLARSLSPSLPPSLAHKQETAKSGNYVRTSFKMSPWQI